MYKFDIWHYYYNRYMNILKTKQTDVNIYLFKYLSNDK